MKLKASIVLSLVILPLLFFSGCFSKESDLPKHDSVFEYSGMLSDGKSISFTFNVSFDSEQSLSQAMRHKQKLTHAFNMTVPQYSSAQLKGNKVKILLRDVLNQVFCSSVKSFEIKSLKIE